jgi:hypothetical protein
MNFLVDAQLPRRMTAWLAAAGCNAIHTLDLPNKNRTTPLWLRGGLCLPVELEATYERTCIEQRIQPAA